MADDEAKSPRATPGRSIFDCADRSPNGVVGELGAVAGKEKGPMTFAVGP